MTTKSFKNPWFLLVALVLYILFDLAAQSQVYLDVFGLSPGVGLLSRMMHNLHITIFVGVFHLAMLVIAARGQEESRAWISVAVGVLHLWFAWSQTPFAEQANFWMQSLYGLPGLLWGIFAGGMYYALVGAFMEALQEESERDTLREESDRLLLELSDLRAKLGQRAEEIAEKSEILDLQQARIEELRAQLDTARQQADSLAEMRDNYPTALEMIALAEGWTDNPDSASQTLRRERRRYEVNGLTPAEKRRSLVKQSALRHHIEQLRAAPVSHS